MNKVFRIASATVAMVLLLLTMGSCSKESRLAPEDQLSAGAGQLTFKLDNDALRSVPAEAFEKEVDPASVWCVFLTQSGAGTQTVKVAKPATKTPSGEYAIKADFEGAAQMFVIANVQDALKTKLVALTTASTLTEVQKLVVENALGNNTTASDKFIMTSDLIDVTLPTIGGTPYKVADAIKLKRLAARFDVISEVPGLTLTTVSVAKRVLSSTLLNVNETGTIATTATDYTVTGGKQLLHKIYSYQNTNKGGTTDATSFTLKGNYGGKAIKDIKVDLKDATNGEALAVQRNYCYRILIKPANDDSKPINPDDPTSAWKVTIKEIDWNEAASDLANYSDEDLDKLGTDLSNTVNPTGINLLDAVAEYNIDITGTKFITSHTNEANNSGIFTWSEAKALTMPVGYHLPTHYEWVAILGLDYQTYAYNTEGDVSLTVQIPGQTKTMVCKQIAKTDKYKEKFDYEDESVYVIRYMDNDTYRSAWRYSSVYSPLENIWSLRIDAVPVKANLTIDKLNKNYFANPKISRHVKTIYLPQVEFFRYTRETGLRGGAGSCGMYWSATKYEGDIAYAVYYTAMQTLSVSFWELNMKELCAVRPFRGI